MIGESNIAPELTEDRFHGVRDFLSGNLSVHDSCRPPEVVFLNFPPVGLGQTSLLAPCPEHAGGMFCVTYRASRDDAFLIVDFGIVRQPRPSSPLCRTLIFAYLISLLLLVSCSVFFTFLLLFGKFTYWSFLNLVLNLSHSLFFFLNYQELFLISW